MGLEHELMELNSAYQYSQQTIMELADRCMMLEKLVQDYRDFANDLSLMAIPRTKRDELAERAKELLG